MWVQKRLSRAEKSASSSPAAERTAIHTNPSKAVPPRPRPVLAPRLVDKQHRHHGLVISTLPVHLGARHCLEVSVLRGPAAKVRHLGDELLSTKGVLHGELTFTSGEGGFNRWR